MNYTVLMTESREMETEKKAGVGREAREAADRLKGEMMLPREVKGWMEKIETDSSLTSMVGNSDGTLLQPVNNFGGGIVTQLTVTRKTFAAGFRKKVEEAGRWLSEFIFRLIKIKGGRIKFKGDE